MLDNESVRSSSSKHLRVAGLSDVLDIGMKEPVYRRAVPDAAAPKSDIDLLFIGGLHRSGTTWTSKLFDSHLWVRYRHEPDVELMNKELPVFCDPADFFNQAEVAREYIAKLAESSSLRTRGSLPIFSKAYRSTAGNIINVASIYASRVCAQLAPAANWISGGDATKSRPGQRPVTAIKSVSSCGRMGLFSRAFPHGKFFFVLRHPCGQVQSTLNGLKAGKFHRGIPFKQIFLTKYPAEFGLSEKNFAALDIIEQCAWHWAVLNQKASEDLADAKNTMTVRYKELCEAPLEMTQKMFAFAGLGWSKQTAHFVETSTNKSSDRYHSVFRVSAYESTKWRHQMPVEDQKKVFRIVERFSVGNQFL
jgi:hypothetical protein